MSIRFVIAYLIAATLAWSGVTASAAPSPDTTVRPPDPILTLVARLRSAARSRDSLSRLADSTQGSAREVFEESIWQRHLELQAGLLTVAEKIKAEQSRGKDVTEVRRALNEALREEWPGYQAQLRRWQGVLSALGRASDAASGTQRLAIEATMTQQSERLLESYRSLVEVLLALERVGIDVSEPRAYLVQRLPLAAEGLVTRLQLARRDQKTAGLRLSRDASNAELRYAYDANEERVKRATNSLSTAIQLMNRLGLENTDLRVALIATSGNLTADVFKWPVLLSLLKAAWKRFIEFLAGEVPRWIFQGLLIVLTFLGFRALSHVVRAAVRKAVQYSTFSQLLRSTVIRLSSNAVMVLGFLVILRQFGVQVAPLLAGLGIAGVVVGFAMQNTLSNFAAGGMILGTQPFNVGDEIEVAGVAGIVKRMTLVSTTILTPDNQTLIIPNSTVWGGVIRNRTTQPVRRVDMTFGIGYGDDLEEAERVLREVVTGHESVLKSPAPIVKLHQLADSSVIFVVRAWTTKERYWDVYWDLTRAVKLRFDQEGISIPFPQRELHVNVKGDGAANAAAATRGAAPPKP